MGITTTGLSTIQDLTYAHDAVGLLTQVTSPFPNEGWSYQYDALHRVVTAGSLSNPAESQTFEYDEIDRIVYNSRIGGYNYPPVGNPRPHAPSDVAGNAYTYDLNGNLVSGGGRSLTWNADNLPTQINDLQVVYAGTGERLKKASPAGQSLYPLGDDFEITNGVITKYVSAGGLGVIAKRVGTTTYWLHQDRAGSIQAVTDASGAEVFRRMYRPYGDTLSQTGSHAESRGYIDQRLDEETGLTYLHARYYDSSLGVFISPDPLHPVTPGVGTNRYAYAFGDPVNGTDRAGTDCTPIWTPYGVFARCPAVNVDVIASSVAQRGAVGTDSYFSETIRNWIRHLLEQAREAAARSQRPPDAGQGSNNNSNSSDNNNSDDNSDNGNNKEEPTKPDKPDKRLPPDVIRPSQIPVPPDGYQEIPDCCGHEQWEASLVLRRLYPDGRLPYYRPRHSFSECMTAWNNYFPWQASVAGTGIGVWSLTDKAPAAVVVAGKVVAVGVTFYWTTATTSCSMNADLAPY